jgi:hypothetical protein
MSVFSGVASCVSLSVRIIDLLLTSKHNKQEFRSLKSAVQNIKVFLTALPQEGISEQGNEVLSEYKQHQQQLCLPRCSDDQELITETADHASCMVLWDTPTFLHPT